MPGDDIANIWLDSGANVFDCMPRGCARSRTPLKRGLGRARRCTLDARADYHLNVPTGGQPLSGLVTLTAPTYLSKGEIHLPLSRPLFVDDRLFRLMMLCRRKGESSRFVYTHISYSLLTFSTVISTLVVGHLKDRSMNNLIEKNMIESIELVARIVRSCREKMDTSNRLSPRGVSTPGALFPLFPRDLTYLSFHWYCIRTATDDDKSRESLARFCWKTSKQIRVNDTPHPQAWIRDLG